MRWMLALAVLPLLAAPAFAQEAPPTIESAIPKAVLDEPRATIVTVVVENDAFGGSTDSNYSSGVRANFTNTSKALPDLAYKIDRLLPMFTINETTSLYYSLGQNIYTPSNITRTTEDPRDRPWAAFLYGSMGMVTLTGNHTDEVEATLGVVGPLALGEPLQKFVHKYISDSPTPEGWSHQLKDEPGGMLAWQRAWPMLAGGNIGREYWSFKPYAGATVGNIRTYADTGFSLRLSPEDSKWQDTPVRVRPAMPGTGIYQIPKSGWSWSLFSGLEGRAVARDIFLDGNTFANSYSVDKRPLVADATAGAALTRDNLRFSYTLVYRTKEFVLQDHPEIFGAFSVGARF